MKTSTFFVLPLTILQLAAAITVLAITAMRLGGINDIKGLTNQKTCLLSSQPENLNMCYYTYAVGAVSIVLTIIIGLLQLVTCKMCGAGAIIDAVFTLLAAVWWLVAGFVLAAQVKGANDAKLPNKEWRTAVVLLAWITACLFGLLFFVHVGRLTAKCCCKGRRKGAEYDMEKAAIRPPREPSAAVELGNEIRNRPYMMGRSQQQQQGASSYLSGPNI